MSNNELFEYLFALRISLQDSYENESDIIRELRIYLRDNNIPLINETLHEFYELYGINVSVETINEVSFRSLNLLNNMLRLMLSSEDSSHTNNSENEQLFNNNNDNDNNNDNNNNDNEYVESEDNIDTINNFANTIFQILSLQNEPDYFNNDNILSDVIITTDEHDLKTLKTYKLENNLDVNCAICIENMKKDETILELKCSHTFHCDCIKQYLEKYNYKCPICREEVGKPKYNI